MSLSSEREEGHLLALHLGAAPLTYSSDIVAPFPATPRGSWVGILHGTVSALPGGRTGLLCRGSQAVLEQLAPTRHCGGWGKAGTSRPSALSHGVRETQTCVKEELGRGASAPRPPRAFLSLFILLFLHKGKFCGI